jgi:outer membrane protein W
MRRWFKTAISVVGALLMLSNAAFAQLREDLELNIFGAGSIHSSKDFEISFPQSAIPISGQFKLDDAIRAGLRVNVFTRGHWGQEFFYSYEPNKAHFLRRTTPPASLDLSIGVHNFGVTGLYYFSDDETKRVRPFLSIGLGATVYRLTGEAVAIARDPLRGNVQDIDQSNEIAMNYGAGFKTKLSSWFGFRMDVKGFLGRNPSFGLARQSQDPNATVFPAGGAIHNGEASAGLIFYFGRP